MGLYGNKEILVNSNGETAHYKGDAIIVRRRARWKI